MKYVIKIPIGDRYLPLRRAIAAWRGWYGRGD